MSNTALPLPEPHDDTAVVIIDGFRGGPQDPGRRGKFGWMISGGVHASVILLAMIVVTTQREVPKDAVVTRNNPPVVPGVRPQPDQPHVTLDPPTPTLPSTTEIETSTPTSVDVSSDVSESETDDQDSEVPQGKPDALSSSEMGNPGFAMAMGTGSNSPGIFGERDKPGRKKGVKKNGGSEGSENAVERALKWFKRHQSLNGSWETDRYYQNCSTGAKCEPGGEVMGHGSDQNVAMTAYAVLCFLGAGYDHQVPSIHKAVVRKGLDWLLSVQKNDGYFGLRNYEHPIATMALAEAYAMTLDPALRAPAQKAVDQILAHQNQDGGKEGYAGGLGWDYTRPTRRNDASVTGWNVMALKSALAGGLNVGKGMAGSKQWLEQSWKASNATRQGEFKGWQEITAYDKSHFAYCWTSADPVAKDQPTGRESIGLVCAIFLGHTAGDAMVESLANTVLATQLPTKLPTNTYYLYYNTMGMFQVGGEKWRTWNATVRDLLVHGQQRGECADGSWDWSGNDFTGAESGRVLTTAYNTLSLEVYYRNERLADIRHR